MAFFLTYIRKYGRPFSIALFALTVEAVIDLLLPTILSQVIDEGVAMERMDMVWRLGLLMLLLTGIGAVAACVRNIMASRVSQAFGTELRSDLFRKIQSLSFEAVNRFDRASLITRLTNDVTLLQNFMNGLMRIFVKAPLLCLGSIAMAIRLNPRLSVILLAVVPVIGLLIVWNMKAGFSRYLMVQKALDRINLVLREYLSGVRVVKAFNRFDYETGKMERANMEYQSRSVQVMKAMAFFNPAIMLTVNLGILAVLWYGGYRVDQGLMQVGHIIAFINYMTQILFALMLVSLVFMMFVRAKASAQRISEVLAEKNTASWEENRELEPAAAGKVEFEQVGFSYEGPSGIPVLKRITFICKAGETIGIIGSTGSGKSSLVGLIPRFYDADSGNVRVSGTDVRAVDPRKLREKIAVVPQKSVLFTGTIADNIRWGKPDATREEVESAARIADAHSFIASLPEGYDARLGQKGINLSGGQKQRLSIARALIRRPEILILDDCTSALDVLTEDKIKKAIKAYASGMTCFIIAQRISSVRDADRILVMDEGEIIGAGTHEELLETCGVYREIYLSQGGKELSVHVKAE